MPKTLWPHQQQLVGQFYNAIKTHDRILLQLCTGGGKTAIAGRVAYDATSARVPVLAIAHREELIEGLQKEFHEWGIPSGILKAGYDEDREAIAQVASIQSLPGRKLPPAGLVIIDEAHRSLADQYLWAIAQYPDAKLLGLTATPCRTDGRGLDEVYQQMVLGPSMKWLIRNRYLSPYRVFNPGANPDLSRVKIVAGDYSNAGLNKALNKPRIIGNLVTQWKRFALGRRTIVFAVNVEHSKAIAKQYCKAGIAAEHIDGDTPKEERKEILKRFKSGKTLVLVNCELFIEGVDVPGIECVQIARPTISLRVYLQMIGRGMRYVPGKTLIILDHVGAIAYHGLPDDDRQWSLEGSPPPLSDGIKFKKCPKCETLVLAGASTCSLGHPMPTRKRNQIIIAEAHSAQLEESFHVGTYFDEMPSFWMPEPEPIIRPHFEDVEAIGINADAIADEPVQLCLF